MFAIMPIVFAANTYYRICLGCVYWNGVHNCDVNLIKFVLFVILIMTFVLPYPFMHIFPVYCYGNVGTSSHEVIICCLLFMLILRFGTGWAAIVWVFREPMWPAVYVSVWTFYLGVYSFLVCWWACMGCCCYCYRESFWYILAAFGWCDGCWFGHCSCEWCWCDEKYVKGRLR